MSVIVGFVAEYIEEHNNDDDDESDDDDDNDNDYEDGSGKDGLTTANQPPQ